MLAPWILLSWDVIVKGQQVLCEIHPNQPAHVLAGEQSYKIDKHDVTVGTRFLRTCLLWQDKGHKDIFSLVHFMI